MDAAVLRLLGRCVGRGYGLVFIATLLAPFGFASAGLTQLPATFQLAAPDLTDARAPLSASVVLTVSLLDAEQRQVAADREYRIELSAVAEATGNELIPEAARELVLAPGEWVKEAKITFTEVGFIQVSASSPLLLTAGLVLHVLDTAVQPQPAAAAPDDDVAEAADEKDGFEMPDEMGFAELPSLELLDPLFWSIPPISAELGTGGMTVPSDDFPRTQPRSLYRYDLRASVGNPVADGRSVATLTVFLMDETEEHIPALAEVALELYTDFGVLGDEQLIIEAGRWSAKTTLTSERAGVARVFVKGATYTTAEVTFEAPHIALAPSQPEVSLIEPVILTLRLHGRPVEDVQVTLILSEGAGRLNPATLTFRDGGASTLESRLIPTWGGNIAVTLQGPESVTMPQALQLRVAAWFNLAFLLGIALVGSAAGAYVRLHGQGGWKVKRFRRKFTSGVICGLVVYFAFAFGLLPIAPAPVADVVADIVLNPFGAFVLAAVGGFIGERGFELLADRFAPPPAPPQNHPQGA